MPTDAALAISHDDAQTLLVFEEPEPKGDALGIARRVLLSGDRVVNARRLVS